MTGETLSMKRDGLNLLGQIPLYICITEHLYLSESRRRQSGDASTREKHKTSVYHNTYHIPYCHHSCTLLPTDLVHSLPPRTTLSTYLFLSSFIRPRRFLPLRLQP